MQCRLPLYFLDLASDTDQLTGYLQRVLLGQMLKMPDSMAKHGDLYLLQFK